MAERHVVVVGSGPSGVHFAETALAKGYAVTMVDAGRRGAPPVLPAADFDTLKSDLADPAAYFLGNEFEGVLLPSDEKEYYGIPPGKHYVFESADRFAASLSGFDPLFSLARGGLAQAWTAGCYPFNDAELSAFPFSYKDLQPHYDEVSRRIGVTGEADDLARFMPVHDGLLPPLPLDVHSQVLVGAYARKRARLNALGAYLGRTRVAVLSRDHAGRGQCDRLGRCLWGCPKDALYTPSQTVADLERQSGFRYRPGFEVLHFQVTPEGRVTDLVTRRLDGRGEERVPVDLLALAAGTLPTAAIILRSVRAATGTRVRLDGLMDNRQVLVPFLTLRMLGRPLDDRAYQYHLLGMGLEGETPQAYVHGQITTLKTALLHPIIQKLPFDLRTSMLVTRAVRSALGVVNVNLHDTRRADSWVELDESGDNPRLRIRYMPDADEPRRLNVALGRVRRVLRTLGCILPPGMEHIRPMGASVHYAGTFPMMPAGGPWTTDAAGRLRAFANVLVADGSTFPFLPAKNLTFTLMANASRVAAEAL